MPNKYEQGVEAFKQYRLYSKSENQEDYKLASKIGLDCNLYLPKTSVGTNGFIHDEG